MNDDFMNIKREDAKHMVGPGWSKIIDSLYDQLPIPKTIHVHQVKEKFGGLRFYVSACTKEEYAIIDAACALSERTCEQCGEPAEIKSDGYWLTCLCDKCLEAGKKV